MAHFDPYSVLARSLERESALLSNLREVVTALDESPLGPAVKFLPQWQLEKIEASIEASEDETQFLYEALAELDDEDLS